MRCANIMLLAAVIVATSVAQSPMKQAPSTHIRFQLSIPAFPAGGAIPREHTCDGADQSPELRWRDVPAGTVAFALVMHDPDAPAGDWVHWIVWNIPSTESGMTANFAKTEELPNGTRQGPNGFRKIGYNGPCPPSRKDHKYFFQLYAMDTTLDIPTGAARNQLDAALKGHVLAEAEYMGTYHR